MLNSFLILAFFANSGFSLRVINGDPYFCVPPGICPQVEQGGIDPRILTPDGTVTTSTAAPAAAVCPQGQVVCYAQGPSSNCGRRLVSITTTTDGFADTGAYPWQAYLEGSGSYIGSGSLLSPYHVLTAAHKVLAYQNNPAQLTIIMGVNDPTIRNNAPAAPRSVAAKINIYNIIPYDNTTLKNDIAIVRLANPISLVNQTSVNTICIPGPNEDANTYSSSRRNCIVSGWGQTQATNSPVPTKLKQVSVKTTDINSCENGFNGTVNTAKYLDKTGGQICAGGEAQRDACFQDGGAPMVCPSDSTATKYTIAGIVIWGKSCGRPGVYGVYTNVPAYRKWIVDTIAEEVP